MQCPNCGNINPEGAKFCRRCGQALTAAVTAPTPLAPAAQPAPAPTAPPPAPAAIAQPPAARPPAAPPGRLSQLLDGTDLLLAIAGTGLGAAAGYLSLTFLPRFSPQLQLPPFALNAAVGVVAIFAALLVFLLMVYWVAANRASRTRMQQVALIRKEKAFFMDIENDLSALVGEEG
jgi:hypothetical protein